MREANRSSPSSTEVKNTWTYIATIYFMTCTGTIYLKKKINSSTNKHTIATPSWRCAVVLPIPYTKDKHIKYYTGSRTFTNSNLWLASVNMATNIRVSQRTGSCVIQGLLKTSEQDSVPWSWLGDVAVVVVIVVVVETARASMTVPNDTYIIFVPLYLLAGLWG